MRYTEALGKDFFMEMYCVCVSVCVYKRTLLSVKSKNKSLLFIKNLTQCSVFIFREILHIFESDLYYLKSLILTVWG